MQTKEQMLFVNVIYRALLDAINTGIQVPHEMCRRKAKMILEARAWFRQGGEDFETVCDFAGLAPSLVQSFALKVMDNSDYLKTFTEQDLNDNTESESPTRSSITTFAHQCETRRTTYYRDSKQTAGSYRFEQVKRAVPSHPKRRKKALFYGSGNESHGVNLGGSRHIGFHT